MWNATQGLFVLAGIALVIAGLNGSRSLVVVGAGLIVLAVVARVLGRKQAYGPASGPGDGS